MAVPNARQVKVDGCLGSMVDLWHFCLFQGSAHNESSNQSLCSVGSLSDKELEVCSKQFFQNISLVIKTTVRGILNASSA